MKPRKEFIEKYQELELRDAEALKAPVSPSYTSNRDAARKALNSYWDKLNTEEKKLFLTIKEKR